MENNINEMENANIKMFEDYPDILTTEDLRNALNIGKNQAYSLLKDGTIKSFKIGRVHKIPKANLISYIMQFQHTKA